MTDDIAHGTYKGAMTHYRRGEKECDACANARREYAARQARIRRNRSKTDHAAIERRALLRLAQAHPGEYKVILRDEQKRSSA